MTSRLAYLFQQYTNDTCSKEEREEFLSCIANTPDDRELDGLMENVWDEINAETHAFPAANDILKNILQQHPKTFVKKISWYRYAAAIAAVLTLVGTGIFFYQNNSETSSIQTNSTVILPGTNKATLTLANGKVINLDYASNGQLAQQSGITVIKTADGQLVYNINEQKNEETTTSNDLAYNTIATPRGGQYQVNLPDGSKVWLNAASSLKYPVTFKNQRSVELTGEAYFEVTPIKINGKNIKVPFIVKTNQQEVEVLGTHFNINSYTDEQLTKSTLLEGSVKVTTLTPEHSIAILKPGQQSILKNNLLTTHTVDTEEAVAWKNGYFQFNESNLGSIMRQLSRWYNIEVVFEGRSENDLFHFKTPKNQSLTEILKIFELNGINIKIEGRKLIVKL